MADINDETKTTEISFEDFTRYLNDAVLDFKGVVWEIGSHWTSNGPFIGHIFALKNYLFFGANPQDQDWGKYKDLAERVKIGDLVVIRGAKTFIGIAQVLTEFDYKPSCSSDSFKNMKIQTRKGEVPAEMIIKGGLYLAKAAIHWFNETERISLTSAWGIVEDRYRDKFSDFPLLKKDSQAGTLGNPLASKAAIQAWQVISNGCPIYEEMVKNFKP